jgi:hypothetical protein
MHSLHAHALLCGGRMEESLIAYAAAAGAAQRQLVGLRDEKGGIESLAETDVLEQ